MNRCTQLRRLNLSFVLAVLILSPAALMAQTQSKASLTLQQVKDRLKQNKKFLQEAQKNGKAGNAAGLNTALENYSRSIEGLNRAVSQGQIAGTLAQQQSAFSQVEKASVKSTKVLTGLLSKVPAQAQPAIQHAIQVSQTGHNTALANLQRVRAQRQSLSQQPSTLGRPANMGRPSGFGAGMGGPGSMGPGMGHPGGMGGAPSGHPGKPGGR